MLAHNSCRSRSFSGSATASSCLSAVRCFGSSAAAARPPACLWRTMTPARNLQAAAPAGLVVFASSALAASDAAAVDELPLWRHLREQQGFSQATIRYLHTKVSGKQCSIDKVQRDLAPNMAALRREGLTTADRQWLCEAHPKLLTTKRMTFMSSLAVVRDLAEHLDSSSLPSPEPASHTAGGRAHRLPWQWCIPAYAEQQLYHCCSAGPSRGAGCERC